jgi:hypothetical protein
MMLRGLVTKSLLNPASCANTAAATSGWVDIRDAEGDILIVVQTGAVTGGIVYTVEHADDNTGTGGAAFTPDEGAFSTVTANTVQERATSASSLKQFMRVVGTITTGPVLVGASVVYQGDEPT